MIALLLCVLAAFGAVGSESVNGVIRIRAQVSADLRTIHGTFETPPNPDVKWSDLLSALPIPHGDRMLHRTFPGPTEAGRMWIEPPPKIPRPRSFHAVLPRRFGASGVVEGRGLFANGLWHPHPVVDGRLAQIEWDVVLELPEGATGTLNGSVSQGSLRYRGTADRLSLSVLYNARVQTLELTETATITLVDAGPTRRIRDMRTLAVARTGLELANAQSFVVVETPLRTRLQRTGPHTLFLSDRAFRVTPPDWATHLPAVRDGLQRASLGISDPWLRNLAGSTLRGASLEKRSAKQLAWWRSWMPRVDSFLYDGRLAFTSETLKEGWPTDWIADDPLELLEATAPARIAAAKLRALYGSEPLETWATAIASGATFEQAMELSGIPEQAFLDWRRTPEVTDIRVNVLREGATWRIDLSREATEDAPAEPVDFLIGNESRQWTTRRGPDTLSLPVEHRPQFVRVDPYAQVLQTNHQNDQWPRPWSVTVTGSLSEISVNRRRATASAYAVARNQRNSHWMHALIANTNPVELVSGYYSLGYEFGRKLDRRNRIWRAWAGPSAALLDPAYRKTVEGRHAVDFRAGLRIDTRDNWPFSRKGFRVAGSLGNGFVPGQPDRWRTVASEATHLLNMPGPFVWAHHVKAGSTTSEGTHRQVSSGGGGGVQGLPIDAHFGRTRLYGTSELRFSPVRDASIPLWLVWVTTLQFTASIESAIVDDATATGWTAGIGAVSDIWGQNPYFTGIWVAKSLDYGAFNGSDPAQFYLRLGQNF